MNTVELQRDAPYFDRNIPITVITNSSSNDEARQSTLTFRILSGTKQVKQAGQTEKLIHFEVLFSYN